MNKGFLKNTAIYAIGDIVPKILTLISFPILTSYLTTTDYGIVNFVNTLTLFLLIVSLLNLNTYYLVHYQQLEDSIAQRKLLGNISFFLAIYNLAILVIFTTAGWMLGVKGEGEMPFFPYIFLGILSNFFNSFSIMPLASLRIKGRAVVFAGLNIGRNALQLLLTVILVVAYKYSASGVLYSIMISNAVFFLYFLHYLIKNSSFSIDASQLKAALRFSLPLVPGALSYLLINMSDRLIITHYMTFNELGIYSTAATLALLINIISTGFYQALEPIIFRKYHEPGFPAEFARIRETYLAIMLTAALGIGLFSREFLYYLSGEGFHGAYVYVPVLLTGTICAGLNLLYTTLITASGNTKLNSFNIMIGCGVSIGGNFLLIPIFGIWGAAISFACAFITILALSAYHCRFPFLGQREVTMIGLTAFCIFLFNFALELKAGPLAIAIKSCVIVLFLLAALRMQGIRSFRQLYNAFVK